MPNTHQRHHDRLTTKVPAQLRLADGQVFEGTARDMGFGGSFLATKQPAPQIPRGTKGVLVMDLFSRPVEMPCHVAHVTQEGIGLELERITQPP